MFSYLWDYGKGKTLTITVFKNVNNKGLYMKSIFAGSKKYCQLELEIITS